MNGNGGQRASMLQKFGEREPEAWTQEQAPIVIFWLDGDPSESIALRFRIFGPPLVQLPFDLRRHVVAHSEEPAFM